MKRLLSEVKAASEKQQTNARRRDGEKVSGGDGGGGGGGGTDGEDRLTSRQNKSRSTPGAAPHKNIHTGKQNRAASTGNRPRHSDRLAFSPLCRVSASPDGQSFAAACSFNSACMLSATSQGAILSNTAPCLKNEPQGRRQGWQRIFTPFVFLNLSRRVTNLRLNFELSHTCWNVAK